MHVPGSLSGHMLHAIDTAQTLLHAFQGFFHISLAVSQQPIILQHLVKLTGHRGAATDQVKGVQKPECLKVGVRPVVGESQGSSHTASTIMV